MYGENCQVVNNRSGCAAIISTHTKKKNYHKPATSKCQIARCKANVRPSEQFKLFRSFFSFQNEIRIQNANCFMFYHAKFSLFFFM